VRHFADWFAATVRPDEQWLVLGKGPSFELLPRFDVAPWRKLSLNHVVRELPVDVAHIIDLDVVEACAAALRTNAGILVMPWHPHEGGKPRATTLDEWTGRIAVLGELAASGRLFTYALATWPEEDAPSPSSPSSPSFPSSPRLPVYFSSEAAISLLARAGARRIRSLGIDGGRSYGTSFSDLAGSTLLANKWGSFDAQFAGIARTIMETGVDYAPLNVEAPVRVYVGSQEPQMLAVKVLEHSIRRHASMSVEVFPLHLSGIVFPEPKAVKNRPRTPFSFQRFTIPALAGYRGRALYVDSDMQVFRDIREIWTIPMEGAEVLAAREADESSRRPQFSVMLLDCERLAWTPESVVEALDSGRLGYEQLMYEMKLAGSVRAAIPAAWNSLERYEEGRTGLLHYTDMDRQPWISRANPLGYLWMRGLIAAVDGGFISRELVAEHVARGWVRPSILAQLDQRIEEPALLPGAAAALDDGYRAPWQTMGPHAGVGPLGRARALARHLIEKSPAGTAARRLRAWLQRKGWQ
jgi:hypothetical protein